MTILKNTLQEVQILLQANASFNLSDLAFPSQNVASVSITKVFSSVNSASGAWSISRGANVVWQCGNFAYDFKGNGVSITQDKTANVSIGVSGGSGSILVVLSKESNF